METSNLAKQNKSGKEKKIKQPTLKTKKTNLSKVKFQKRKSEQKRIDNIVNTYIVSNQLYEDVPPASNVRNLFKKVREVAQQDPDFFEKSVLYQMGILHKTSFSNTSIDSADESGYSKNSIESKNSLNDLSRTFQESRCYKGRRSVLADRDTNTDLSSSHLREDVSMTTISSFQADSSIISYQKPSLVNLNNSDHEISEVFSKLSLRKKSLEKPKRPVRKAKIAVLNTSVDKENFLHGTQRTQRKTQNSYLHNVSSQDSFVESPKPRQTMNATIKNMFEDISMIQSAPLDQTVTFADDSCHFISLDETTKSAFNNSLDDTIVQEYKKPAIRTKVAKAPQNIETINGRAITRSTKTVKSLEINKTNVGKPLTRSTSVESPKKAKAKKAMTRSTSAESPEENKVNTRRPVTRTKKRIQQELETETSEIENLKEDNSILMCSAMESPPKSLLDISNISSICLNTTQRTSSEEEYFSGLEDTVVPATFESRESVQFLEETRLRTKLLRPDNAPVTNEKKQAQVERSAVEHNSTRTRVLRSEAQRSNKNEQKQDLAKHSVQFKDVPEALNPQGVSEVRDSLDQHDPGVRFNMLLKNITVRRGGRKIVHDPELLQRTKVSLAPGKMWKRSLIDKSILERESHKFSRSIVDYDESMLSTVSFRSKCRSVSMSSRSEDSMLSATGTTLYESVLCADSGEGNNDYCREKILEICGQTDIVSFEDRYPHSLLKSCKKIGEGVYGEVFKLNESVIKIMPIEGAEPVNGEEQKQFREIFSEIMVTKETSDLQYRMENSTPCFTELLKCSCVKGRYPRQLIQLWEEFAKTKKSYNDHPSMFREDQMFIILELKNGGVDSVDIKYRSPSQTYAFILQVIFSLAVAEVELDFEHRDLHMSNILIRPAWEEEQEAAFTLDDIHYSVRNAGVMATIIDFTISRCYVGEKICYYDLSQDEELFQGEGDYQFEMYRMMRAQCKDNWQLFTPRNNVVWIHYLVKKAMCPTSGYRYLRAPRHQAYELLEELERAVLDYDSCYELVQAMCSAHCTAFPALKRAKLIRSTKRK